MEDNLCGLQVLKKPSCPRCSGLKGSLGADLRAGLAVTGIHIGGDRRTSTARWATSGKQGICSFLPWDMLTVMCDNTKVTGRSPSKRCADTVYGYTSYQAPIATEVINFNHVLNVGVNWLETCSSITAVLAFQC